MGSSNRRFNIVFAWTETVQSLIAEPAQVTACCGGCKSRYVDLERIRQQQGPLFSFWNRRPPCPTCGHRAFFYAQRIGANVWMTHMKEGHPGEVERLHAAWREERIAVHRIDSADPQKEADMEDRKNCDETVDALEAADQLVDRLQDKVVANLKPDSGETVEDLAGDVIAELETAPEIDQVRTALGRDPNRFGSHPGPGDA